MILHPKPERLTQVYEVDLQERYRSLLGLAMLNTDTASDAIDGKLYEEGGEDFLLGRMTPRQRRLWEVSPLIFDAFSLETPYDYGNTYLALAAMRETHTGQLGRMGVYTIVGYRTNRNPALFTPLDCPTELSFAVNSMSSWHESLSEVPEVA